MASSSRSSPPFPMSMFEGDLQAMKTEANRRRLGPLKDAVERCLSKKTGEDVWAAMIMGADVLRGSRFGINCVSNLGKMASMRVLPLPQLTVACQVLRSQLDTADDELSLRMVQTVIAFVSACEAQQTWIEAPLSFIFVLHLQCRSSMVQAACTASISQVSTTLLDTLNIEATEPHLLQTQMIAVDYFRDLCNLITAKPVQWLKLDGSGAITESFQLLLLDILSRHFSALELTEQQQQGISTPSPSSATTRSTDSGVVAPQRRSSLGGSTAEVSAMGGSSSSSLLTQALNVDLVQMIIETADPSTCSSSEVFQKIHKLGVTVLQHAHRLMTPTVAVILGHHEKLIAKTSNPWRMALLLSVWRKPLGDAKFLKELLKIDESSPLSHPVSPADAKSIATERREYQEKLLTHASGESGAVSPERTSHDGPALSFLTALSTTLVSIFAAQKDGTVVASTPMHSARTSSPIPVRPQSGHGPPPASALSGATATSSGASSPYTPHGTVHHSVHTTPAHDAFTIGSTTVTAGTGILSAGTPHTGSQHGSPSGSTTATAATGSGSGGVVAQPQHQHQHLGSPEYVTLAVEVLTMLAQSMARLAERSKDCSPTSASRLTPTDPEYRAIARVAPGLLQCCRLALELLVGEDILHAILKTCTHMIQCGCLCGENNLRDDFLRVLSSQLQQQPVITSPEAGTLAETGSSCSSTASVDDGALYALQVSGPPSGGSGAAGGGGTTPPANSSFVSATQGQTGRELSVPNQSRSSVNYSPVTARADVLQQRLHVLSSLVSIASAMGKVLREGWSVVVECLLNIDDIVPESDCSDLGLSHESASLKNAVHHLYSTVNYLDPSSLRYLVEATVEKMRINNDAHIINGSALLTALCKAHKEEELESVWDLLSAKWQTMTCQPHCPPVVAEHLGELSIYFVKAGAELRAKTEIPSSGLSTSQYPRDGTFVLYLFLAMFENAEQGQEFRAAALRQVHRLVERVGAKSSAANWRAILRMLEITTSFKGEEENLSTAFRTMEFLHHGWITNLPEEALGSLLSCIGAFLLQNAAPEKININLTAAQVAWAVADYMASMRKDELEEGETTAEASTGSGGGSSASPHHWSALFAILRDGGCDVRPEIRQSSLKTLFSLMLAHGNTLPPTSWHCCVYDVMLPLMDHVAGLYAVLDEQQGATGMSPMGSVGSSGRGLSTEIIASPQTPLGSQPGKGAAGASSPNILTPVEQTAQPLPSLDKQWIDSHGSIIESACRITRAFYSRMAEAVPDFEQVGIESILTFVKRSTDPNDLGRADDVVLVSVKAVQGLLHSLQPLLLPQMVNIAWVGMECAAIAAPGANSCSMAALTLIAETCRDMILRLCSAADSALPQHPSGDYTVESYLARFFPMAEGILGSRAVETTYMYPAKAQMAVLEAVVTLFPFLHSEGQWQGLHDLLLSQMPLQPLILSCVESKTIQELNSAIRKLRLGYLAKVCEVWYHVVETALSSAPPSTVDWFLPQVVRALTAVLYLSFIQEPRASGLMDVQETVKAACKALDATIQRMCQGPKLNDDSANVMAECIGGFATYAMTGPIGEDNAIVGGPLLSVDEGTVDLLMSCTDDYIAAAASKNLPRCVNCVLRALIAPSTATATHCMALSEKASELLHRYGTTTVGGPGSTPPQVTIHRRTISAPHHESTAGGAGGQFHIDPNVKVAEEATATTATVSGATTQGPPISAEVSTLYLRNKQIIVQYLDKPSNQAAERLLLDMLAQLLVNLPSLPPQRSPATLSLLRNKPASQQQHPSQVVQLMPWLIRLITVDSVEVRRQVQLLLHHACAELHVPADGSPK